MPDMPISVEYRAAGATAALVISEPISMNDVATWWNEAFDELHRTLRSANAISTGPDGRLFRSELFEDDVGQVVAFIPIADGPEMVGRAWPAEIPAAEPATAVDRVAGRYSMSKEETRECAPVCADKSDLDEGGSVGPRFSIGKKASSVLLPEAVGREECERLATVAGTEYTLFETRIGRCAIVWNNVAVFGIHLPESSVAQTGRRTVLSHPGAVASEPPESVQRVIAAISSHLGGDCSDLSWIRSTWTGCLPFGGRSMRQLAPDRPGSPSPMVSWPNGCAGRVRRGPWDRPSVATRLPSWCPVTGGLPPVGGSEASRLHAALTPNA